MEKDTKVILAGLGCLLTAGAITTWWLHGRVRTLERIAINFGEIIDADFQKEVDEKFEEIVERIEDE